MATEVTDPDEHTRLFALAEKIYAGYGPRGTHHGIDAIKTELQSFVKAAPSTIVDVKTLVSDGGTVMLERVDNFEIQGKPFGLEVAGVFEVDGNGESTAGETTTTSSRYKTALQTHWARQADHSNSHRSANGTPLVSGHVTARTTK